MISTEMKKSISLSRLLLAPVMMLVLTVATRASAPGITGPVFNLTAQTAFLNQPDGTAVYSWGYGCIGAPAGYQPKAIPNATCPSMQVPGPTLIVTEGQAVTVTLLNGLPASAGNTSILFPDFQVAGSATATQPATCVAATPAPQGLLAVEVAPGCSVTYTFTASRPGTHAYYSGTQGDLQIEMGLYGALIVLPATIPANCSTGLAASNVKAEAHWGEMDGNIHRQALERVSATQGCVYLAPGCSLLVPTEPYHPAYFLINGRSMPDDMDANYAPEYPHQPYNGDPHMHPGEQVLIRTIGQGRWQHPFHEHGNHVRILARDGNMLLTPDGVGLTGLLMFNTDTTPGQAFDGIFYWTGRGLNWDPYAHHGGADNFDALAVLPCTPDVNGYNTGDPTAVNYYEWCQDHDKPLEAMPFGDVASGGPATLPNPNIFTNGPWYGGTPYLGPDATLRSSSTLRPTAGDPNMTGSGGCATGQTIFTNPPSNPSNNPTPNCSPLQPSNVQDNPASERGYAFMWHSHNEREITTNNVFPGGMLMMMLVDSREFVIDESN
jgi:FtsP/CotA-like multicopper oxidase with cupredoxin domain